MLDRDLHAPLITHLVVAIQAGLTAPQGRLNPAVTGAGHFGGYD